MHNSFVSSFPHGEIIRILADDDNGDDDSTDDECISPITLPKKFGATGTFVITDGINIEISSVINQWGEFSEQSTVIL
jgi:hypothetical protein